MGFYDHPENVKTYIQMCEDYDGSNIHHALANSLPLDSSLLELGSGAGLDIEFLQESYAVTGSDLSDEFLRICKEKHPKIPFLKLDALKLNVDDKFDCIYSNKVLHHLTETELKESLKQQTAILTRNGMIAHSFWLGEGNEEMSGLLFTYYTEDQLVNIISDSFEILSSLKYEEFEESDSLFVIARPR